MNLTQIKKAIIADLQRDYYLFPKKSKHSDSSKLIFINQVMDFVCEFRNIDKDELLSQRSNNELTETRYIIIYICNKYATFRIDQTIIGNVMNRHHATIIANKKRFNDLFRYDTAFRLATNNCEKAFKKFQTTITK